MEDETGNLLRDKRVFVATDDPKVIKECKTKFPGYTFYSDQTVSELASPERFSSSGKMRRYTPKGLLGIISDIHILSLCDHLVCTMTSNICRLAYELQQTRLNKGPANVNSLDTVWHFFGHDKFVAFATSDYKPRDQPDMLSMKTGDVITFTDVYKAPFYERKGYILGYNTNTTKTGYLPLQKIQRVIKVAEHPAYPKISAFSNPP